MAYNKQQWKDEIPDLTKPIKDASGKQKTDPQTGRPLYELVQEGTRITSDRLNHMEEGIETAHNSSEQKADAALAAAKTYTDTGLLSKADKSSTYSKTETDERIQAVVGAAPDALDTLKEIGDALNNDPDFAGTMTTQLASKVDKVQGKQLSTEDFSSEEKAKLAGLTTGAGGAGSATDAVIGNRTIVDTEAPTGDSGPPSKLWGWLAYMIKAITGKSSWRTTPATTLEAAKTHADDSTRHITAAERTSWNGKIASSLATAFPIPNTVAMRDEFAKLSAMTFSSETLTEPPLIVMSQIEVPNLNTERVGGLKPDTAATGNTVVARNSVGNVSAASLILGTTGRISTASALTAGGQGGIIQMTSDIGSSSGYGTWQCYNCYWDGSNWIQPRGNLPSYAYTVNNHLKFSWRFAAAGGTDGAVITLSEVALMDHTGLFNPKGGLNLGNGATSPQAGVVFKPADNAAWFWLADISGVLTFGKDGAIGTSPLATLTAGGVFSATQLAASILTLDQGSEALKLKAGALDHIYLAFYARTASPTARSGYIGYGGAGSKNLDISNQESGGGIQLITNNAAVTLTGPLQRKFTGSNLDSKSYENLAYINSSAPSATGTIKISLPKSWNNTMMAIKISGYNYNLSHGAWELLLGGYNYTGAPDPMWYNTSATLTGAAPFTSVRFAHDGTNCCILLGTIGTVWNYPKVVIERFTSASGVIDGWETGWSMALITTETGITVSSTPVLASSAMVGKSTVTNLNTVYTVGSYYFTAGAAGTPPELMSVAGQLLVYVSNDNEYNGSSNTLYQILLAANGTAWYRSKANAGAFTTWANMGVKASDASLPNYAPIRDANKKIAEVAAQRSISLNSAVSVTQTAKASFTASALCAVTAKATLRVTADVNVTITLQYTNAVGTVINVDILPNTTMGIGEYEFIPKTVTAGVGQVSVLVVASSNGKAFTTAILTEE